MCPQIITVGVNAIDEEEHQLLDYFSFGAVFKLTIFANFNAIKKHLQNRIALVMVDHSFSK